MKKLIDIPTDLVKPLKQMAVENDLSFHAQIIESLAISVNKSRMSDIITGSDLPVTVELHDSSFFSSK